VFKIGERRIGNTGTQRRPLLRYQLPMPAQ
jgi:hypothetical protein